MFYLFSLALVWVSVLLLVILGHILNIVMYKGIAIDSLNLKYGLLLGILSYLTYMFYILSFSQKNTSISVTIYRLHMIPAVIFAIIFFNESISEVGNCIQVGWNNNYLP